MNYERGIESEQSEIRPRADVYCNEVYIKWLKRNQAVIEKPVTSKN